MKYFLKHPLSILALSVVIVWFVHSQTTTDPVDALFDQFDAAKTAFEKNPRLTQQALDKIQTSLKSFREPTRAAADLWHEIGRFYFDQNADYPKALMCFEQAFALRQKHLAYDPSHNDLARSQFMLGATHKSLCHYQTALQHIEQAVKISEAGNNDFMLAKEYLEIGGIYDYLSDYDQSIVYTERAYPHIIKGKRDQANLLSQHFKRLAGQYLAKEENRIAIQYHKMAIQIFNDSINPSVANFFNDQITECWINMNMSYRVLKQPDSALFCLNQALMAHKKSKSPNAEIRLSSIYIEMGNHFLHQNKFPEAQKYHQKAIAILAQKFPNNPVLSGAYAHAGEDLLQQKKPSEALAFFNKALNVVAPDISTSVSNITTNTDRCLTALSGIAQCYLADKKTAVAFHYFQQLDTLMTNLRSSLKEDGSKFNLSKAALPIYENAISAAMTLGDTAAALDFCERNKAVVLRAALQERNAKQSVKIDPSVSAREKQLNERIAYYQKQRFDTNDSLRGVWQDSIQRAKGELEALIQQLERSEPDYFKQKYAPIRSLSVDDIQKNLPPDVLFVEYFVGDNQLVTFAISKTKTAVYPSVLPLGFRDSIDIFLKNIRNASPDAASLHRCATTSYALYNWLLQKPLSD